LSAYKKGRMKPKACFVLSAMMGLTGAGVLGGQPQGAVVAPYLQNTTPDGVSILWETAKAGRGQVHYGPWEETPTYPQQAAETKAGRFHRVRLAGLEADRRYCYRVAEGNSVYRGEFRTAPARSRTIRFAVIGDSRFWRQYWEHSALPGHLAAQKPEFLLHMGDLVDRGHDYLLWPRHFARFGSQMTATPMFVARGNHEGNNRNPATDWFARYHELPGGEPYASFDWGNSHFALVSYFALEGKSLPKTAAFLDKDLGASTKPWKFVAVHLPVYSTGYQDPADKRKQAGNPSYEAVFDKHRVDMHMSGHTHIYERSFPWRRGARDDREGTVYLVQGGNVGGHYPAKWSAIVATEMDLPHYTMVEVRGDSLELRSFGLAKGTKNRGLAAPVLEVDRLVRWRDESLPKSALARLDSARGTVLLETVQELGAMAYGPVAPRLAPYLSNADPALREAAALALERIANPAVAETLLPHLRHPDLTVRRRVARALECAMSAALAAPLGSQVLDESQDAGVRVSLLGALLHHAPEAAPRLAFRALASRNDAVRDRAADVVKRTAALGDLPELLRLYRAEKRSYVATCLAWGINRLCSRKVDVVKAGSAEPDKRNRFIRQWQTP
jgi:hypothetical protein